MSGRSSRTQEWAGERCLLLYEAKPKTVPHYRWVFDLSLPIFRTLLSNIFCPIAMTFHDTFLLVVILGSYSFPKVLLQLELMYEVDQHKSLLEKGPKGHVPTRGGESWCARDRFIIHIFSHQSILKRLQIPQPHKTALSRCPIWACGS